ncbi:MAG: low molecular weight phosphotyrosine protein phosphatase, partial [Acidobacteriota bacterium]
MTRVLFVCTGNICRSPTAEAVARETAMRLGEGDQFEFDSAGTKEFLEVHVTHVAGVVVSNQYDLVRAFDA